MTKPIFPPSFGGVLSTGDLSCACAHDAVTKVKRGANTNLSFIFRPHVYWKLRDNFLARNQ